MPDGLKPKDLIGIPWRVAFALQDDGWFLRSGIVWHKPNPMPESVLDRPTTAHEFVFLMAKRPRYFYNADAIREPFSESMMEQLEKEYTNTARKDYIGAGVQDPSETKARIIAKQRSKVQLVKGENTSRNDGGAQDIAPRGFGANCRSVWRISTKPYPEAHFATFTELARKRIGNVAPLLAQEVA